MKKEKYLINGQACLFFSIIILGAFLRFYGLGFQSFWTDELFSWYCSQPESLSEVIKRVIASDGHPPAFHLILHFVQKLGYDSEAALRLPSAVSGVFSIGVIFLLGRRLFSSKEALIAAALMAVLIRPVFFSQEARPYSMLLLFTLLSVYFGIILFDYLDKEGKIFHPALVLYILSASITCYLHYYGVLFVFLQGAGALFFFRKKGKIFPKAASVYLIIVLLFLPWASVAVDQIKGIETAWIREPEISSIFYYLRFIFIGAGWLPFLIIPIYSILFLRALMGVFKRAPGSKVNALMRTPEFILLTWLLVPYIIAYIVSVVFTPVMVFRYLIMCFPAAYLLVARAITFFLGKSRHQFALTFIIVAFLLYHLVWQKNYYWKIHKEQYREATAYIAEQDPVFKNALLMACVWNPEHLGYYFERWNSNRKVDLVVGKKDDIADVMRAINEFKPEYFWFMRAHRIPEDEFMKFLLDSYPLIQNRKFRGAHVWLFRVDKISGGSQ